MSSRLRAGDLVEVLDVDAILRTLDSECTIGRMPFMPEMQKYCGRRFRVSKVAHKTCDTANKTGARRLEDCYHLEDLRCDGSSHGGCQATCLLFWKGAWLRKVDVADKIADGGAQTVARETRAIPERLLASTRVTLPETVPIRYSCQVTQLFDASHPLPWWNMRQYWQDMSSGNVPMGVFVRVIVLSWFRALTRVGIGYRLTCWMYEKVHRILTGKPAPLGEGLATPAAPSPSTKLDLVPGEKVMIKSHLDIRKTLNANNKNRGLWFDQEYVPFCESERRVSHRVTRILNERTGEMLEMKNPCIVLEGVKCEGHYSLGRLFCPRAITAYWREEWLTRARDH